MHAKNGRKQILRGAQNGNLIPADFFR